MIVAVVALALISIAALLFAVIRDVLANGKHGPGAFGVGGVIGGIISACLLVSGVFAGSEQTQPLAEANQYYSEALSDYYSINQHYTDDQVELRLLTPQINDIDQQIKIELDLNKDRDAYYLTVSEDGESFSTTADQQQIIDRSCDAQSMCEDGQWRSADQ